VDAQVHAVQRAVAAAGLVLLLAAGLVAWVMARALARPLVRIAGAAHDIAMGRAAEFPDVRVPELANHVDALRAMHHELERRFEDLRREREESRTLLEALSDGVIAADQRGNVISTNAAARRLLGYGTRGTLRSEEHTSELQSRGHLVCRLLLEKKKTNIWRKHNN